MIKHYKLGSVAQIPPGEGRNFQLGPHRVAVFRTRDDTLFATQASCPHRQGPLADGLVGGSTLICPLHEWRFDLSTGRALSGTCGIAVYAITRGEDDELELELPVELATAAGAAAIEAGVDAED